MSEYMRVIRTNPNFARLWSAQVISLLGDWFNTIALSVLVSRYSGGSGLAISLFLMARFLPPLLFSPVAGVLVDRFDRKKILVYCNLLRTGIVLAFLLVRSPDMLWLIYVLTILQFTLSALFEPGQSAITPSLVPRRDLVIANTLASVTWSVMLALGAIVGGIVSALLGIQVALVIDAATFAVAGYLIAQIQVDQPQEATPTAPVTETTENGSFWEGLRFLRRHSSIAATATVKGWGSIGNVDTLMTVYATQLFIVGDGGQLSLGIMYSAFGVGAVLGPFILNYVNNRTIARMRGLIVIGFILPIISWVLLGSATTLFLISCGLAVRAMGGSANWTYSSVIIQESVPDRYLGRVFALDLAFFQLVTVASTLIHGGAVDLLNQKAAFLPLEVSSTPILAEFYRLMARPIIAGNLDTIVVYTGIVSVVPLVFWLAIMPYMSRQPAAAPAPAD